MNDPGVPDQPDRRRRGASGRGLVLVALGCLATATIRYRCRAGLRATYLDQLQGIVYTIGVLDAGTDPNAPDLTGSVITGRRSERSLLELTLVRLTK